MFTEPKDISIEDGEETKKGIIMELVNKLTIQLNKVSKSLKLENTIEQNGSGQWYVEFIIIGHIPFEMLCTINLIISKAIEGKRLDSSAITEENNRLKIQIITK